MNKVLNTTYTAIHQKGKLFQYKVHIIPYTAIHQKGKLLVNKVHNTTYTAIHQKGKLLGNKVHNTTYTAIHQKGKVKKKNRCVSDRPTDPKKIYAIKYRSAKSGNSSPFPCLFLTSTIFFISLYI